MRILDAAANLSVTKIKKVLIFPLNNIKIFFIMSY